MMEQDGLFTILVNHRTTTNELNRFWFLVKGNKLIARYCITLI